MKKIVTRFAPSPTGSLHIGGARTALFNYLYARANNGQFLIRIEDTDKQRSTQEAVDIIKQDLSWLGLTPDTEWVFQSKNEDRHIELANKLLAEDKAYKCFCTTEELSQMRENYQAEGRKTPYDRRWRDETNHPSDLPYVIRLKMPLEGRTTWVDDVQGEISFDNAELEDLILVRSDNTPTYNLAVVADDNDMGVTNIIRGDDHINNTPKQINIYKALGFDIPTFAHIPLIHGEDGKKMSKRHGATTTGEYKENGFMKEAILNFLARLSWSLGDKEVFSMDEAIANFDIKNVSKGSAVFDNTKLEWLNSQYIQNTADEKLVELIADFSDKVTVEMATKCMPEIKTRAKTLKELAVQTEVFCQEFPFVNITEKATGLLETRPTEAFTAMIDLLNSTEWNNDDIKSVIKQICKDFDLKMGKVMMPMRAMLLGTTDAPGVVEIMIILGKEESIKRLSM
ncbi:MAG TPA: glutamate--tRNA ligase [Alphaproteobacteria bacterium]|nr:glutamate--tRNA ligase [Alphaproteobacteria bacterium]